METEIKSNDTYQYKYLGTPNEKYIFKYDLDIKLMFIKYDTNILYPKPIVMTSNYGDKIAMHSLTDIFRKSMDISKKLYEKYKSNNENEFDEKAYESSEVIISRDENIICMIKYNGSEEFCYDLIYKDKIVQINFDYILFLNHASAISIIGDLTYKILEITETTMNIIKTDDVDKMAEDIKYVKELKKYVDLYNNICDDHIDVNGLSWKRATI